MNKEHIEHVTEILERQLKADGYTNVTTDMARKAVINGFNSIRDDLIKSKCPCCGRSGCLTKEYMVEEGVKYPVLHCNRCGRWS